MGSRMRADALLLRIFNPITQGDKLMPVENMPSGYRNWKSSEKFVFSPWMAPPRLAEIRSKLEAITRSPAWIIPKREPVPLLPSPPSNKSKFSYGGHPIVM